MKSLRTSRHPDPGGGGQARGQGCKMRDFNVEMTTAAVSYFPLKVGNRLAVSNNSPLGEIKEFIVYVKSCILSFSNKTIIIVMI